MFSHKHHSFERLRVAAQLAALACSLAVIGELGLGRAHAQTGSDLPPLHLGVYDTPAADTGMDNTVGVAYSRVFNQPFGEPAAPYTDLLHFPNLAIDPTAHFGNHGYITADLLTVTTDFTPEVPFVRQGFAPPDAKLKLGPLYIDWSRVTTSWLFSDNINRVHAPRRSGVIGIVSANISLHLQLTEGLYMHADGQFVYLPLRGKLGLSGFGLHDPYGFSLSGRYSGPSRLIIGDQMTLGGWNIELRAEATTTTFDYRARYRFEDGANIWENSRFNERDVAGTYSFGSTMGTVDNSISRRDDFEDYNRNENTDDWVVHTLARISRDIPLNSSVHLSVAATRLDSFQNRHDTGTNNTRLVETTTESYNVQLTDERIQTRFKPFITYTVSRNYDNLAPDDDRHRWTHTLRGGFAGPASENISLYADAGVYWTTKNDTEYVDSSQVYRLGINHQINQYMQHSLALERTVSGPSSVDDTINYNHRFIVGPHITAVYYYEEGYSHERFGPISTNWFRRHGANIFYDVGPRLLLHARGYHQRSHSSTEADGREHWRFEVGADYRLNGAKTTVSLTAVHSEEKGIDPNGPIVEDLVILTITRVL